MKKFIGHIALFALPFLALLVYVVVGDYDKAHGYMQVQKDCRSGTWVYKRIYENPKPIDMAFVGSSFTMCDVNDAQLEERLRLKYGMDLSIANLGICRHGIDLHYLVTRDLFERHQPKVLFLEVQQDLNPGSHIHFPNLAAPKDVFFPPFRPSMTYFTNLEKFLWLRWRFHRESCLNFHHQYESFLTDPENSFMVVANDIVADSAFMQQKHDKKLAQSEYPPHNQIKRLAYLLEKNAALNYLSQIQQLCEQHGTRLVFLYLPQYGTQTKRVRQAEFLESMGPLLYPPDSVFGNPKLYFDPNHLNQAGANRLTDWLTEETMKQFSGKTFQDKK